MSLQNPPLRKPMCPSRPALRSPEKTIFPPMLSLHCVVHTALGKSQSLTPLLDSHMTGLDMRGQDFERRGHVLHTVWKPGAPHLAMSSVGCECACQDRCRLTGASFDCTGCKELTIRRVCDVLETSAYRRNALDELFAMDCMRACESAALRARLSRDC